jgi:cell division protein FtsB
LIRSALQIFSGSPLRRTRFYVAAGVLLIGGLFALRGPQGVQSLLEKHREIRQLEEHNAALALENQRRRERIERLENSTTEQEMEIRKQLKLLRPGETTFILPDAPQSGDNKSEQAPAQQPQPRP